MDPELECLAGFFPHTCNYYAMVSFHGASLISHLFYQCQGRRNADPFPRMRTSLDVDGRFVQRQIAFNLKTKWHSMTFKVVCSGKEIQFTLSRKDTLHNRNKTNPLSAISLYYCVQLRNSFFRSEPYGTRKILILSNVK